AALPQRAQTVLHADVVHREAGKAAADFFLVVRPVLGRTGPEDVYGGIDDGAPHAARILLRIVALLVADARTVIRWNGDVELRLIAHLGIDDREMPFHVRHLRWQPENPRAPLRRIEKISEQQVVVGELRGGAPGVRKRAGRE